MPLFFLVKKYRSDLRASWNEFVSKSKNATFLFYRDYMDYHSDRFNDFSILIYKNKSLVGLIPANIFENSVYSHQGLSYGGLLLENNFKTTFFEGDDDVCNGILQGQWRQWFSAKGISK